MQMREPWHQFYAAEAVRELDRRAIEDHGIAGYTLMQRAARAAWQTACEAWGKPAQVVVLCGQGNNGGDGYEIARLAAAAGIPVALRELPGKRKGDAATARNAWLDDGGSVSNEAGGEIALPERAADCWVVDALFGTGLSRAPDGVAAEAIGRINDAAACGARVLAVDIPSGLRSDSGSALGAVVCAQLTVTFIGDKPGLHTGNGVDVAGRVVFAPLEVPGQIYAGMQPLATALMPTMLPDYFPPRKRGSHKGRFGHVLLIGGAPGMAGAVLLAGRAALRSGAGLVSVATHPDHAAALCSVQPELMVKPAAGPAVLPEMIGRADVVAIGPGLGTGDWSRAMFAAVFGGDLPLVMDADALNLLAEARHDGDGGQSLPGTVLTPHPGEAARLLGCTTSEVEFDRLAAVRALQQRYGAVAILKGAGSLVADGIAPPALCTAGNPGMACGGSGDVLTGIIAACIAQGMVLPQAVRAAVLAHAHAGDIAACAGTRGMLPGDLVDALRGVVNP